MAQLSWSIQTSAGTTTFNGPTISDANMDRFLDWVWDAYPQYVDPDATPKVLKTKNNANLAAAYRDWAQGQWRGLVDQVKRFEDEPAAKSAKDKITKIDA